MVSIKLIVLHLEGIKQYNESGYKELQFSKVATKLQHYWNSQLT